MKTRDLFFDLPEELIAQHPPEERGESRLMAVQRDTATVRHRHIRDVREFIAPGTVMVFNDSRVRRARIFGIESGRHDRQQEFLLVERREGDRWLALAPRARRLTEGRRFRFAPGTPEERFGEISAVVPPYREITFNLPVDDPWLDRHGHMPLPPYIHRSDAPADADRYQNVYSRTVGSVAAPTAGLHFTEEILQDLRDHGVRLVFVTLHVGIGTFIPVRTEEVEDHHMHSEDFAVPRETADAICTARQTGKPVLAVGTTAVRTLESCADPHGMVRSGTGSTEIFITPGYQFRVVDQLLTNFHTPGSTLIALVGAFAGLDRVLSWYREAVNQRYRFFSYGDAMLIT